MTDFDLLLDLEDDIGKENADNLPDDALVTSKRTLIQSDVVLTNKDVSFQPKEVPEHPKPKKPRMEHHDIPVVVDLTSGNIQSSNYHRVDNLPKRNVLLKRIPISDDYVSVTFNDGARYYLTFCEASSDPPKVEPFTPTGLAVEAELLATNRALLRWLKAWDAYVFGSVPTTRASTNLTGVQTATGNAGHHTFTKTDDLEQLAGEISIRDGLPRYRVVLLAGFPGVGKTTVAHILAQHAGYQVIEVNASDERTVSSFKDQLDAVVSTSTSLNMSSRNANNSYKPCCLILDEIDGALPAAVEVLANAAKHVLPTAGDRQTRGKRANQPLVLRRPVICICNDLFSTAVRPLRAPGVPCLILRFPSVELGRLISRLDNVARMEHLAVDKMILTQLAEYSNRDIRSCLNAMQFLKSHLSERNDQNVSQGDLSALVGLGGALKDVQRSLFDVWNAVFTIPPARILTGRMERRLRMLGEGKRVRSGFESETTLTARVDHVMDLVQSVGDLPMVAMGIFENYLNARMKDASLNMASQAANWFVYHDQIFKNVHSHMNYQLVRYASRLPAWFHLSLASATGLQVPSTTMGAPKSARLQWPAAHTEANNKRNQSIAILDNLLVNQWAAPSITMSGSDLDNTCAVSNSFRFLPRRSFLLDVAPIATTLIALRSANLRPLNAQLYSQQEKMNLKELVNIMLALGLDWSPQQNTETGEMEFQLEPPLDSVTRFQSGGGGGNNNLKTVSNTTKHLISRELNLERMRRSARNLHTTTDAPSGRGPLAIPTEAKPTAAVLSSIERSSRTKKVKKDFFGRPITIKPQERPTTSDQVKDQPDTESHNPLNQAVYYRFREGYSNAVRCPVTLKNFL